MDERMNIQSWWMLRFCSRLCFCCFMSSDSWPHVAKKAGWFASLPVCLSWAQQSKGYIPGQLRGNSPRMSYIFLHLQQSKREPSERLHWKDQSSSTRLKPTAPGSWSTMVLVHWPFTWLIHRCMYVYTIVYQYIPIIIYSYIYTHEFNENYDVVWTWAGMGCPQFKGIMIAYYGIHDHHHNLSWMP
jgi:hypothetical protein